MEETRAVSGEQSTLDPRPAGERFPVDVPGYCGSLEQLVIRAQRGEIDLSAIPVATITTSYRRRVQGSGDQAELRELADFLTLAARLVALKAARLNPSASDPASLDDEDGPLDDPGSRLSEYRLFKAAADALLAGPAEEGTRSFLGLVAPDVVPLERLRIPPERLAAAFRDVLARLSDAEPLPVGAVTFSVQDKLDELRARLRMGPLQFEDVFASVSTRLEAVACFLALLEMLRLGEADVEQPHPYSPITVRARG